ncbi:class I SAM-dependent methyltransferase [Microbacterium sp. LBN7]|uniref:class I SAM-dependent methyltransferase n=1 Tax=Microbacterium sp. LBN7 TaxID=3129773 RepID=UPI003253D402
MVEYWNHNSAYHPWIIGIVSGMRAPDVLDVGCGEGLLLQRLAPLSATVTGVEPDPGAAARAGARLLRTPNASVTTSDFAAFDAGDRLFDVITFVAALHHMDTRSSLAKAETLLRPGGKLLVVGLAANRTFADWAVSGIALPWVRLGSMLHRESRDIGVPTAEATENVAEIRAIAHEELPGARLRRGLYYRYLLSWTKPTDDVDGAVTDPPR